jgi:hypothetical protein
MKGNLVIYRPDRTLYSGSYYSVDIDSAPACRLGNGGFFIRQMDGRTTISASKFSLPGTSRITVKPPAFVKIEAKDSRMFAPMFGGLIAGTMLEAAEEDSGPYKFTLVTPKQAKQELQGLKQDCM